MKADQLERTVQQLEAYPAWQEAIDTAAATRSARPRKSPDNPAWLRAQAEMLEAQELIAPATQQLQVEVAQATDQIDLPTRLGLLEGLERNIAFSKQRQRHPLEFIGNVQFSGDTLDLKIKDYKHGARNPFHFAEQIAGDIHEVEKQLPRIAKKTPAALLRVGQSKKPPHYTQPTAVNYYMLLTPPNRKIGEEPSVVEKDGVQVVEYDMPWLSVIPAKFFSKRKAVLADPDADFAETPRIRIPSISMRLEDSNFISPRRLLIGAKVAPFAVKHMADVRAERKRQEDLRESRRRLDGMRF